MGLTRIVVHVENDRTSETCVAVAAGLAAEHRAALVGLIADETPAAPLDGVPVHRAFDEALAAELRHGRSDAAARFHRVVSKILDASSTLEQPGDAIAGLLQASLTADLVVVNQDPGPGESGTPTATPVVLGAPCPVLVVPRSFVGSFTARRILIGWKGTAPTARAMIGALPLLHAAKAVLLVHVRERGPVRHGGATLRDAGEWLERHGVEFHAIELPPDPDDPGHALLDEADRFGADLIVAGAWAKSPFREKLLGGATATLLDESELPLLLAH